MHRLLFQRSGEATPDGVTRDRRVRAVQVALSAAVLLVFAQTIGFDFINFDDPKFVVDNPWVRNGLGLSSLRWAFSLTTPSQFHPLTWISYMADAQLFGIHPAAFHAVNVALHLAATLLLFSFLRRATGRLWPSAAVALLFAVHPLRAESVAWVAERKDVLSTCLVFACLVVYAHYAARPSPLRYTAVSGLFLGALLAKPMAVTLPILLLLLDYWPLGRTALLPPAAEVAQRSERVPVPWSRLILEKVPLLLLSLVAGVLTIIVQAQSALQSLTIYPLDVRLRTAVSGLFWYVRKLFWPRDLALFYPYDRVPDWTSFALLAGAALAVAVASVLLARRLPFLAVGLSWYVLSALPILGLVQVGSQRVADRYSYLPQVGLLVALVFALDHMVVRPRWRVATGAVAIIAAAVLGVAATRQVALFRDSETVFRHALRVSDHNYVAHANLAGALLAVNKLSEAEAHYRAALEILPQFEAAWFGLGATLQAEGRDAAAAAAFVNGLEYAPRDLGARRRLVLLLLRLGAVGRAREQLAVILDQDPADARAAELLRALDASSSSQP